MDLTPQLAEGNNPIDGYGNGGFTIGGERHEGALLVRPSLVEPWIEPGLESDDLRKAIRQVRAHSDCEIVLLGTGAQFIFLEPSKRQLFREAGLGVDAMDTGAACRTFNVLLTEGRRVAALLVPVD